MSEAITINRQKLSDIASAHGICYLALFGSFARGEATSDSDIDLAIRFSRPVTLFDYVDVQLEMEAVLGSPVDLVPIDDVYEFVRESMNRDLMVLYEAPQETVIADKRY